MSDAKGGNKRGGGQPAREGEDKGARERGKRKGPQPYIGGPSYRTFTLQSCVVIYGCRSLIRRIRTPLSPHVCCPSIDPIYRDDTGVRKVSLVRLTLLRKFARLLDSEEDSTCNFAILHCENRKSPIRLDPPSISARS